MTAQLTLDFSTAPRPLWSSVRWVPPGSKGKRYESPSGWAIEHCGHPTANWPYFLEGPTGELFISGSGYAFSTLKAAKSAVAGMVSGRFSTEADPVIDKGREWWPIREIGMLGDAICRPR